MLEKITPSYIVAIGASAGGIEELITFFEVTPLDSVAYVIVQHLSAKHKSQMVTVLSRYSKLMVEEAEENMVVGKNRVYLIPGDKYMTIENGRLHLVDKSNHMMPHLTINTFFKSLAFNHGDKAIGVILSGMGTDGTDGVVAIHKKGGFVIVRNPDTSTFNSMPGSAIHAGVVDLILEPELMPAAIDVYVHQGKKVLVENQHEHKYLNQIIALVQKDALLDFSEYKKSTILRRTKKRAGYLNINQLSDYFDFLKINPTEGVFD
jgi:two-component system CheB/CheR fusion protein